MLTAAPLGVVVNAINDNAHPRGPDRYLVELLRHMRGLPDAPRLHLLRAPWQDYLDDVPLGPDDRLSVVRAPRRPLPRAAWQALRLPSIANATRADVAFLPNLLWNPGLRMPAVMTAHDLLHFRFPEKFGRAKARAQRFLIRRALATADRIVAVSDFTAADAVRFGKALPARIVTILEGGPPARPRPAGPAPDRYFLFVGKIETTKNVERLVEAFTGSALLRDAGFRLKIAGPDGNAAPALAPLLATPGVDRLGFVDDAALEALYAGCRGFVFPSEAEGFGLVVLEAMARGAPVIAARATSLPEVVGDAGILVAPGDVAGLRAAMERLAADDALAADLTRRGYEQLARFSWHRAARETLDCLREAAALRPQEAS
ncbi:MAG TPA: glycosyltransferase family 1 protein [Amaricoccus sp.]|nr:glycosyltransferase family 1 protein [Amaricoccus sp.]